MIKTFEVECNGSYHRIQVDDNDELHLLDHDIDEEETLYELGGKVALCYHILLRLEKDPDDILTVASAKGDTSIVSLALAVGANVQAYNNEALRSSAREGHSDVVSQLLQAGADANARDSEALQEAAYARPQQRCIPAIASRS